MSTERTSDVTYLSWRALHREEMRRFGHELAWLDNPDSIPEAVLTYLGMGAPEFSDPYFNLSEWMIDRFAKWSEEGHSRLSLAEVFDRYNLTTDQRVRVRQHMQEEGKKSYSPGLAATGEIHAVVPSVASREGITSPDDWTEIAARARDFGVQIARDGTEVQTLVRHYLAAFTSPEFVLLRFDPARLKLDPETGITSVTPIEEIIRAARSIVDEMDEEKIEPPGVCSAIQVRPQGLENDTMFGAAWGAYSAFTGRYIYPRIAKEGIGHVPPQTQADTSLDENLRQVEEALLRRRKIAETPGGLLLSTLLRTNE